MHFHLLINPPFLLAAVNIDEFMYLLFIISVFMDVFMDVCKVEDDGELFYSLDDGNTRFSDLLQLVEFYQLNRGVLPCKLKHHCAQTTL